MGRPVEVDSDDLESLLFATAAIKTIEGALKQAKDDPFAANSKTRLHGAHDRIANAWRTAGRKAEFPERFELAKEAEVKELIRLWPPRPKAPDFRFNPVRQNLDLIESDGKKTSVNKDEYIDRRELMTSGFIEIGNLKHAFFWGSSGDVTTQTMPEIWLRPTKRGIEAIEAYERAAAALSEQVTKIDKLAGGDNG